MATIVTDTGFAADDWTADILELQADADINDQSFIEAGLISIAFASSADGRGFTLARLLRLKGYKGRLRAKGHVLADQYAMARRSGFDEVEISQALAERQPEAQWLFRADWRAHDYQARLRG